jgi:hypothetical protein
MIMNSEEAYSAQGGTIYRQELSFPAFFLDYTKLSGYRLCLIIRLHDKIFGTRTVFYYYYYY